VVFAGANDNGDAIMIGSGGHHAVPARVRFVDRGGVPFWGSGSLGVGVNVPNGNQLIIDSTNPAPTITGTGGNVSVGGYTSLPAVDPTTFVVTASRSLTWANFYTSVAGGGFGNAVFNPRFPTTGISGS
jgi:hypothetical protein